MSAKGQKLPMAGSKLPLLLYCQKQTQLGSRDRSETCQKRTLPGSVGILFIVPRRREVVRVNGTATLAKDTSVLDEMTVNGKAPDIAIIVHVREAFFHCGKAIIRSGLWEPARWGSIDGLPTYAQALKDHAASADTVEAIQARIAQNDVNAGNVEGW
jgi:predicted pyridoxine 5'-phosphate oxidase superfamily flavin-nucleotide-binding protein